MNYPHLALFDQAQNLTTDLPDYLIEKTRRKLTFQGVFIYKTI